MLLNYGICHTIIIDKDSKFRDTFIDCIELLEINLHVASGGHHDPVFTKPPHRYLYKCLRIHCNERDRICTSTEGIGLLLYGWNSAPIIGTYISRSLVLTGREFHFTIDDGIKFNCI